MDGTEDGSAEKSDVPLNGSDGPITELRGDTQAPPLSEDDAQGLPPPQQAPPLPPQGDAEAAALPVAAASAPPPAAPPPAAPAAAPPPAAPPPTTSIGRGLVNVQENAEWYTFGLFFVILLIWAYFIPSPRRIPEETDLKERLADAIKAKNDVLVGDLKRDLVVWNRYEEELRAFEWGDNLNWYYFASLRVLVIVLGAITPALIVAPALEKKKFLAALPAAVVAIGAGFISEFDFKSEAARYHTALTQLEGEKTAFISQSPPLYGPSAESKSPTSGSNSGPDSSTNQTPLYPDVPYPILTEPFYPQARANFAFRIEQIFQREANERVQFLRSEKPGANPK